MNGAMDDITRHAGVQWVGAADVVDEPDGVRPTRVPPGSRYQLALATAFVAGMCSGVRACFRTDSPAVELVVDPVRVQIDGVEPEPARFDLVIDGELADGAETGAGTVVAVDTGNIDDMSIENRGAATVRFDALPAAMKSVEVWLPHTAVLTVQQLAVVAGSAVEPSAQPPAWIHYGSSISHCMEADRPTNIWPAVAARAGGNRLSPINLGYSGECHTDQFVARFIRDRDAALISLKLGINSLETLRERTFRSAVHGFLDTVRDGHPATPVVVCSPIYSPDREAHSDAGVQHHPDLLDPYLRPLTTRDCRTILAGVVADRVTHGDEHLHYLDGLELFGPDDIDDLPDRLHPNTAGYRRMGERFAAKVLDTGGMLART